MSPIRTASVRPIRSRVSAVCALLTVLLALPALAQPTFAKSFSPDTIGVGSTSALTFTIETVSEATDLEFTDILPAGLVFASPASPTLGAGCDVGTLVTDGGGDSVLDGDTTLNFSSPRLGAGETCTLRVDVTGDTAGTYTNVSNDLTSSNGNSGTASDDLTLTTGVPSFSKEFSPDSVAVGDVTRLTFVFVNSGGNVFNLSFSDPLPSGLEVATVPNATNSCLAGLFNPSPGDTTVSLFAGALASGLTSPTTCELGVDVLVTAPGTFDNRTTNATSTAGNSGFAVDQVTAAFPDPVNLTKTFDDPVPPGGTTDLVFTISNSTRDTVTGIAFTDDLDATLSGLQATGPVPLVPCGVGSSISGSSLLTFSGGTLASGDSCSFSVEVTVPGGAAAGTYPNTTSSVTSSAGTYSPASDDLDVGYTPVLLKQFCEQVAATTDPCVDVEQVEGGEILTARFTVFNPDPVNAVAGLTFSDDFAAFLGGSTVSPNSQSNVCGGGSVFFDQDGGSSNEVYALSNGSVAADDSCTFQVDVQLPTTIATGTYVNETTPIIGDFGSGQVAGNRGRDQVTRSVAPVLTKVFEDPVGAGDTVDLVFTLDAGESPLPFTDIAFTDDLDATLSGLSVLFSPLSPCGGALSTGSGSSLSLSGASLGVGETCSFTVTLQVPAAAAPGSYPNTTSDLTATAGGEAVVGDPATDNLDIISVGFVKGFLDDPTIPGGTVTLAFQISNLSDEALSGMSFTDDLDAVLTGLVPTDTPQSDVCGTGSQLAFAGGLLTLTGGNLGAGANCSFSTVLQVPAAASAGEYLNQTSNLSGVTGGDSFVAPAATDSLLINEPLSLSKSFTDDPAGAGGTVTLSFTLANTSPGQTATDLAFTDDLDATLSGLQVLSLPMGEPCGTGSSLTGNSVLTLTGASLAPMTSCTFEVVLSVPDGVSGTFLNQTSDLTGEIGGMMATVPGASDSLTVTAVRFTKAFAGDAAAGGTVDLVFTIENLAASTALSDVGFTDDLDAVISGLVAVGGSFSGCGAGAALSGTSVVDVTGISVAADSTCVVTVQLAVPSDATVGTYTNTSGPLLSGSSELAPAASDDLTVVPAPGFSKLFDPAFIPQTGVTGLVFTINNTASTLPADDLAFVDNLPAGVVVAAVPDASTTCTGGTLTAVGGSGSISYSGGSVAAGATCTLSVDVTSDTPGGYTNLSGSLTSSLGDSGTATADLTVTGGELALSKVFTDPVLRGGAVDLRFTLVTAAASGVTDISFSDDLGAVLPGLTAVGLPAAGFCGAGSQITGTTVLTVTGAEVPAASNCTFTVILNVPADAPLGIYTNTTSSVTGERLSDGLPTNADPATAPLEVVYVTFTKEFLTPEVPAGEEVTLRFTLTNPDGVNAITGLTFSDDLDAALPRTVALGTPQADVCGAGSILTGSSEITLSNGSLPAGGSCTFDVRLRTSIQTPEGVATNVTSPLSGVVSGNAVSGDAGDVAEADLTVLQRILPAAAIPVLDLRGLLLLIAALGAYGVFRMRG